MKLALAPIGRPLGRLWRPVWRLAKYPTYVVLAILVLTLGASVWGLAASPVVRPAPHVSVNDVTRLNPIRVDRILSPTTTAEIVEAVRAHAGPVSIGGGRYSMGGQTATSGAVQLDLRQFDRILAFDPAARTITVQSGARWRDIQEHVDPHGLSVKIMQTYANFTVGGSLSVNAHGRYVGLGPLILSVRSLRLVLADGREVIASPTENADLFYGAIGGYGGLGVITEVSLDLAENVRVKRSDVRMSLAEYRAWFVREVRDSADVIFHNADLYPDAFDRVNAVSYTRTDEPVTVPDRLIPADRDYRVNRFAYWLISEGWGGKLVRERIIDPLLFRGDPVTWRNYEASYDVAELEPRSRDARTYVLQEYFVPVERLESFVGTMRAVLDRHEVNAINVSIRHARPDPGSLLAWARTEVFALVLYYKQGTGEDERASVARWTRELIDAAVAEGGAYYLPYQVHATEEQFLAAYPRAPEFFALKRRLDPTNKFRNVLWDRYYLPTVDATASVPSTVRARLDTTSGYARPEEQTFLAHPEWYIVYSSEEYAAWMKDRLPSAFPYIRSIGQYWVHHREMRRATSNRPFNGAYHVMLGVIGVSYSAEFMLKGLYENTIGRLSGLTSGGRLSDEDRFAHRVATEYARFLHDRPWYEYPFLREMGRLWREVPFTGTYQLRKLERRAFLSTELLAKASYGGLIRMALRASSDPQAERIGVVMAGTPAQIARSVAVDSSVTPLALDSLRALVSVPRYRRFTEYVMALAHVDSTAAILEIAGNDEIVVTGTAPAGWTYAGLEGELLYTMPLPIDRRRLRFTVTATVPRLLPLLRTLQAQAGVDIDHVYDY